jgi:hypothetical protein
VFHHEKSDLAWLFGSFVNKVFHVMSVSGSHYHNNHDKQHHFWGQADFTGPGGPLQDNVTARRN